MLFLVPYRVIAIKSIDALEYYTFSNRTNATLYVPKGSKRAYQAAEYWKEFKEIIEIEVSSYVLGDANGDGVVNVSDVTAVINKILGKDPQPFNEAAADVKADGIIDVSDVTAIINIILGKW